MYVCDMYDMYGGVVHEWFLCVVHICMCVEMVWVVYGVERVYCVWYVCEVYVKYVV